jgi:hypothetical protein
MLVNGPGTLIVGNRKPPGAGKVLATRGAARARSLR